MSKISTINSFLNVIVLNHQRGDNFLVKKACQVLKKGGLVVVPSDTVYGLAADATNKKAVEKLINFKGRPPGKAISVFVRDLKQAEEIVFIKKKQRGILNNLLPGPFTIVLPAKGSLVKDLESEKGTLGIRLPKFDFINRLVDQFGKPITATSANLSGQSSHYSISSLLNGLTKKRKKLLDLIIDFGKLPRNKPSTVIDLSQDKLKILRTGDLNLKTTGQLISKTPRQTKKIGQFLVNKFINEAVKQPLIFLLEGELGVGKTIFVKGVGETLGVEDIISPSFVVYYQYQIKNKKVKSLYHLDLYLVKEAEEFDYLGIEQMLKPKTIICIEWGEKMGEVYHLLASKGKVVYIKMKYITEKKREIEIKS